MASCILDHRYLYWKQQHGVIKVTNVIVLDDEENFSDHYPVKCEVSITGARVSNEKVICNERYSHVWSQEAKMKYFADTCVGLQRWIENFKQCGTCIFKAYAREYF